MTPTNLEKFYITTSIPYVNAKPHLGFALELIQADVIARYHRQKGEDVFFLAGADENALKNVLSAKEKGVGVKEFVDENTAKFKELKNILNLSLDSFIRTTEDRHARSAQKLWQACQKDIYKKEYSGLYCVGCEEFKTDKDLVDGFCPEHPNKKPELVEEENYFFRLSAYQNKLINLIESNELKIIPETRRNEALSFIRQGLEDFSISRSKARAQNWGIPVPGDNSQIIYVWFDALINYLTALDYADNSEQFKHYWQENKNILHVIGKGIIRFHAVYWPAMLLSAGVNLPKEIFVHGYLTIDGQKISKSLGNVISPDEPVKKYGVDAVRYYLLREIAAYGDGDFSYKKLEDRYNGDLANGLGNLVARVAALGEKLGEISFDLEKDFDAKIKDEVAQIYADCDKELNNFKFNDALAVLWRLISFVDRYINDTKPWTVKDQNELKKIILNASYAIYAVAFLSAPFLPETAKKIKKQINFSSSKLVVKKGELLFPRLS